MNALPSPSAPGAAVPPGWLKVASPRALIEATCGLGPGELHAIALAKELQATRVLMDDRDATRFAQQQGLQVIGTLAVLELGASRDLLELPDALDRLQRTSFRVSPGLIKAALSRNASRRQGRRDGA